MLCTILTLVFSPYRIAKFLRNSIRRSLRRLSSQTPGGSQDAPLPPTYASVVVEIQNARGLSSSDEAASCSTASVGPTLLLPPPPDYESSHVNKLHDGGIVYHTQLSKTLGRSLAQAGAGKDRASVRRICSDISPRDVARVLRSSMIRRDNESIWGVQSLDTHNTDSTSSRNASEEVAGSSGTGDSYVVPSYSDASELNQKRSRRSTDSQLALIFSEDVNSSGRSSDIGVMPSDVRVTNSSFQFGSLDSSYTMDSEA